MKHIYIVLIKAHTGLGKFARMFSKYDYTHIAVSLDSSLTDFVTYSRRRHYLPLDAGFMHEYRDYYAFGRHSKVKVKVFDLPVEEHCYEDVLRFISSCEGDEEQKFNLFSMATMSIFHGFRIYKAHNCMSFCGRVIQLTGVISMEKPYYKYSIQEMDALLEKNFYFEGMLKRKSSPDYDNYMKRGSIWELIRTGSNTIFTLIKRMIFERSRIEDEG